MNLIPCDNIKCICHKSNYNEFILKEIEEYNTNLDKIVKETNGKNFSDETTRTIIIMCLQKTIEVIHNNQEINKKFKKYLKEEPGGNYKYIMEGLKDHFTNYDHDEQNNINYDDIIIDIEI